MWPFPRWRQTDVRHRGPARRRAGLLRRAGAARHCPPGPRRCRHLAERHHLPSADPSGHPRSLPQRPPADGLPLRPLATGVQRRDLQPRQPAPAAGGRGRTVPGQRRHRGAVALDGPAWPLRPGRSAGHVRLLPGGHPGGERTPGPRSPRHQTPLHLARPLRGTGLCIGAAGPASQRQDPPATRP